MLLIFLPIKNIMRFLIGIVSNLLLESTEQLNESNICSVANKVIFNYLCFTRCF